MSGWKRLGMVFSAIWVLGVISYAAYEYLTFPLEPFTTYSGDIAHPYKEDAKKFWFIQIVEKTGAESLSSNERAYFDKLIREAETQEEKRNFMAAKSLSSFSSGLNGIFFVALIIPLLAGYAALVAIKWVAHGFKLNKNG